MPDNALSDDRHERKYFVITPHLVRLGCRTTYDYTLWCTVAEIAGEEGECWIDTRDLAAMALMSVGAASDSRAHLLKVGLLEGEKRKRQQGGNDIWHLRIPDLWPQNVAMMSSVPWRARLRAYKERVPLNKTRRKEKLPVLTALEVLRDDLFKGQAEEPDNGAADSPEDLDTWFGPREPGTPLEESPLEEYTEQTELFAGDYLDMVVMAHKKKQERMEQDNTFGSLLAKLWIRAKGIDRVTLTDEAWEKLAERMVSIVRKSGVKMDDEDALVVMRDMLDLDGDNAFMIANSYTNEYVQRLGQDFQTRARQYVSDKGKPGAVVGAKKGTTDGPAVVV